MEPSTSTFRPTPARSIADEDKLGHLPPPVQDAYRRFQDNGHSAELDTVITAILADLIPHTPPTPLEEMPGSSRLIEDLRFDSLAITEVVFFTEDLLGITISNEEILQVRTLDDIRGFVRRKVSARAAN